MTIHREHRHETPTPETIGSRIRIVRGQRVLLDEDLARLYGVRTKAINQAVARNPDRFPPDFVFPIASNEVAILKSQSVTSSWGGRRKPALAFTEQGVAMLSSVLRSARACRVNVAIMRAFVRLRALLADHQELAAKVAELERKSDLHDERIAAVFEAIRQLLQPPGPPDPPDRIGFHRPP
ncbi:MAG: ORF6N domain-containing protein [Planctomycetes bacterium]|nr:ORF6N domain-containing protein [Planctomycetota bacterium]